VSRREEWRRLARPACEWQVEIFRRDITEDREQESGKVKRRRSRNVCRASADRAMGGKTQGGEDEGVRLLTRQLRAAGGPSSGKSRRQRRTKREWRFASKKAEEVGETGQAEEGA
jgi:hypothetical protein